MGIIAGAWTIVWRGTLSPNMPTPTPDFEKEFIQAIRANLLEVIIQLDAGDKNLRKKIDTFSSRFKFLKSEVEKKIREDNMFRAVFSKDPGKQKIHENIAARFIEKLPQVSDFNQLSHNGLQLLGGTVISRKDARIGGGVSRAKSIDFTWNSSVYKIYAAHKYTKNSGGAQDNQYRDLQVFIREANDSNLKNTVFLAIADGGYYQMNDSETGTTKLQRLKRLANKENVFAMPIDELESFLVELSSKN